MPKRYSIWKVAYIVGVCAKTILRWEKKGIIPKAKRTPGNWRYWSESDFEKIKKLVNEV